MACPICQKESAARFRPFCSQRCADIDLGKWLTGQYAVPSQSEDDADDLLQALEEEQKKPH